LLTEVVKNPVSLVYLKRRRRRRRVYFLHKH